jgi:hypothetical protein
MASASGVEVRLPDLRFVPVESLVPHEQHDEQRLAALVQRMREQSMLKNPPVVALLTGDNGRDARYVVLDGANRATAARAAGFPHMLVQVVRYHDPMVQLSTWSHALGSFPRADLDRALDGIPELERRETPRMLARAQLARREALAAVAFDEGPMLTLHGGRDIMERNALLNAVVDIYRARSRFYRVASDSLEEARIRFPDVTAVVVFPHFEPAEILELATSGARLPAGITRHLIRWRALRVNLPIDRLVDAQCSLEEKNRWLETWLQEKTAHRQVRFYEEPTVLFDE